MTADILLIGFQAQSKSADVGALSPWIGIAIVLNAETSATETEPKKNPAYVTKAHQYNPAQ